MTPDEKLKVVLDIIKKTAKFQKMHIFLFKALYLFKIREQTPFFEQKVNINGDGLSSDMKVTIEEKFNKFD